MSEHLEHNNLISKWLNGELSPEEARQLEASGELDDLKYVLSDIDTWKPPAFDVQKGLDDLEQRKENASNKEAKTIHFQPLLRYAAVIAFLIAGYFGWDIFLKSNEVLIAAAVGETITHELPDGSIVQLDATSEIVYNAETWNVDRTIKLKGQAFFKVQKGKQFKVITQPGSVQVLGTQFNVQARDSLFAVKCYEGKVEVKAGANVTELTKGEGTLLKAGRLENFEVIGDQPEWLEGFSLYDQAPLTQVVEDLKKYYEIKINLPGKYENLRFSGKVTHDDLNLALRSVFVPMEIPYELNSDGKVVFK